MTFSISALPAKRSTKSSAIVFDRRPSQFARAASKIFRSLKTASGSPTGEPALDLTTQHSVIRPPSPATVVSRGAIRSSVFDLNQITMPPSNVGYAVRERKSRMGRRRYYQGDSNGS
jgi:hypothetical protein